MGDHGLDETIDALDKLLLNGVPCTGKSPYCPAAEGDRLDGVPFIVRDLSSGSTLVELFHTGLRGPLLLPTEVVSSFESVPGEDSGVRLWLYLCTGCSGVEGGLVLFPRTDEKKDDLWFFLPFMGGSEEGVRNNLFLLPTERGEVDERVLPVNLRANIRRGDMDSEILLAVLPARDIRGALVGVAKYPFAVDLWPEVLEPASLEASLLKNILRTFSISMSVRFILSRRLRHRCADSA